MCRPPQFFAELEPDALALLVEEVDAESEAQFERVRRACDTSISRASNPITPSQLSVHVSQDERLSTSDFRDRIARKLWKDYLAVLASRASSSIVFGIFAAVFHIPISFEIH